MKTVVALLAVACTVVHGVPRAEYGGQMKAQGTTTTTMTPSPAPTMNSMSPESTNTMSTPNIADQGKQPAQPMASPPLMPQTPMMPQGTMNDAQSGPAMGTMMGQGSMESGSQSSPSPKPQEQNIYQMGMPNNN